VSVVAAAADAVPAEPPCAVFALALVLAPPEPVVCVEPEGVEPLAPDEEVSAATWALVLVDVDVFRVVIAVWTLVELHTRPLGWSLRILLITPSIFEPDPIGPGG
jgi:hypothetical protein